MSTALILLTILAGGFVLGGAARILLPGEQDLTLSATTLIGIVGAALGSFIVSLFTDGTAVPEFSIAGLIGALVGSVIVLGVVIVIRRKVMPEPATTMPSVADLVAGGESATVEFKSTARVNLHTGERDEKVENAVVKTIAGFLNAEGGHLIIGVDDEGTPLGLKRDLATMKQPDHDRYALWLTDLFGRTIGTPATAFVSVTFGDIEGNDVVHIMVEASDRPVFVDTPKGERTADFYVRVGNSTRKLLTDEFADYKETRWK